ncbi:MAG: hypothetical protein Q8Q28_11680 [Pseudomonadota bacterium]|nr:hypothetical protein [Pseudomonadota bacterium]
MIRAGLTTEANRTSGEWVFVDLGFAQAVKSCGLLVGDGEPKEVSFSQLRTEILDIVAADGKPLNLLIEAPLSVAFNENGNPTGRRVERRKNQTRYWYVGLGCSVLVAATYLLRAVHDAQSKREIRLFEGLASFKPKGARSSHSNDVLNLREIVWEGNAKSGRIVPPEQLAASTTDRLLSAFLVAGMDFGVPPIVELGGQPQI